MSASAGGLRHLQRLPAINPLCMGLFFEKSIPLPHVYLNRRALRTVTRRSSPLYHNSSVAVTGTWSDGWLQPRACLAMAMPDTRSAIAGETQM
jgi:hypothetical protein